MAPRIDVNNEALPIPPWLFCMTGIVLHLGATALPSQNTRPMPVTSMDRLVLIVMSKKNELTYKYI